MAQTTAQAITYPRGKHSHRCPLCYSSTACYKAKCPLPQRIPTEQCAWCKHKAYYAAGGR